jgi:hypothetical protein
MDPTHKGNYPEIPARRKKLELPMAQKVERISPEILGKGEIFPLDARPPVA